MLRCTQGHPLWSEGTQSCERRPYFTNRAGRYLAMPELLSIGFIRTFPTLAVNLFQFALFCRLFAGKIVALPQQKLCSTPCNGLCRVTNSHNFTVPSRARIYFSIVVCLEARASIQDFFNSEDQLDSRSGLTASSLRPLPLRVLRSVYSTSAIDR